VIISVVLTTGIGGFALQIGSFSLAGVGFCSLLALVLHQILPQTVPVTNGKT
jgi:uracil permease